MIRFVDLKTGNTFDGNSPYVFWFDGEQSINLIHSQPICFLANQPRIDVGIEDNDIFKLVDIESLINSDSESIYEFEYHDINSTKTNFVHSDGVAYHNFYVHVIYFVASAKAPGEYIAKFTLNGEEFQIGGDFYGENESLYINLSNNGIEIPEIVQKALYNVNIHEETRDNITLNRKFKELLSNYWETIANKGSYKSLYNSLQWFEYGDRLRIGELWKNSETGMFLMQDIRQLLAENYMETLNGFAKTTYISLYYALEKPQHKDGKMILDEERNPKLEYITSKWSTKDLALKLCLLGNFYETYFMPIHLDLIHSTIEDVVYTNTFKNIKGTASDRSDFIYNFEDITCNVKNNNIYRLGLINSYVGPNTLFGLNYDEFKREGVSVGVQREPVEELNTNDDWAAFASQMYSEIGAIVDFDINIPLENDDQIKRSFLLYRTYAKNKEEKYEKKTIKVTRYNLLNKDIKFSLFCPIEGEYDVRIQFDSLSGKVYTKHVIFNVIDTEHVALNVYKVQNVQMLDDYELGQNSSINNYSFSLRKDKSQNNVNLGEVLKIIPETTYIPAKYNNLNTSAFKWKGVCLNQLLILNLDINYTNLLTSEDIMKLQSYYFCMTKKSANKTYTILVSKVFGFHHSNNKNINLIYQKLQDVSNTIYREDYIFVPEFHKLVSIDSDRNGRLENIKYYEITDNDTLCVIPELSYGKYITEYDWEFVNDSKPFKEPIKLSHIKEPFITSGSREPLEPGYYTIKFHYRLTNEDKINTIELNSAFKKV